MKAEKIVLSVVGLLIGLLVAGGAFFVYKFMNTSPSQDKIKIVTQNMPTPSPSTDNKLHIDSPDDESVVASRTVTISGKSVPNAAIIASTETTDQVAKATAAGDFSFTVTIPDGTSYIKLTAILPNGEEYTQTRTITYSTESF